MSNTSLLTTEPASSYIVFDPSDNQRLLEKGKATCPSDVRRKLYNFGGLQVARDVNKEISGGREGEGKGRMSGWKNRFTARRVLGADPGQTKASGGEVGAGER